MNLQQFQYVIEIAKTESITRAAESLCMSQSNLSRSIKDLEHDLGFSIFHRTARGIILTHEGEEFLGYAKKVLFEIDSMRMIGTYENDKLSLRLSVPRASYISAALTSLISKLEKQKPVDIDYKETNTSGTIVNVIKKNYDLGIIRYQISAQPSFSVLFQKKNLQHKTIAAFSYCILMSKEHPLANKPSLKLNDLTPFLELVHGDIHVPSAAFPQEKSDESFPNVKRQVAVYDRGSQFDLLCDVNDSYMWTSPIPDRLLTRYNLVSKQCLDVNRVYKDVLIYPLNHKLRDIDLLFLNELRQIYEQVFE